MADQADPIDRGRETLLRALHDGGVRFVVIGGAALQSHGQRYETEDIDVTPDRAQQNLKRLADVLNHLECRLEVDPAHPEKAVSLPPDYFTAEDGGKTMRVASSREKLDGAPAVDLSKWNDASRWSSW